MTTLDFGKHEGEKLSDVPRDYLWWLFCNLENDKDALRREIAKMADLPLEDWQPINHYPLPSDRGKLTFQKLGGRWWATTADAPTILYHWGPDELIGLFMRGAGTKDDPVVVSGTVLGYENIQIVLDTFKAAKAAPEHTRKGERVGRWNTAYISTNYNSGSEAWTWTADEWRSAEVYDDTNEILAI